MTVAQLACEDIAISDNTLEDDLPKKAIERIHSPVDPTLDRAFAIDERTLQLEQELAAAKEAETRELAAENTIGTE